MRGEGDKTRWWFAPLLLGAVVACAPQDSTEGSGGSPEERNAAIVARSFYAGDVTMRFPATLPTRAGPLAFDVYAGISAATETRLGIRAFADLRKVQVELPALLTGDIEQRCNQDITLTVSDVAADGTQVIVRGEVLARLYTCRRRDTPDERRGIRLISQRVEAVAVAAAQVEGDCIAFTLDDLQLDPSGLIGGIADLIGVTARIRTAVLEGAEDLLEENPVCPDLPPSLQSLAPRYTDGGTREIEGGGMGAALVGSVDASASTLIELLAVVQERGIVEGQQ
ncbi:MAG: hypothetical protein AAGK37_02310 [Pseudomonadota bacterium]